VDISVIVVTRGGGALLADCVRSIAAGVLQPLEIILVDQAPPGQRAPLSDWLAGSGIHARCIGIGPAGVSEARNLGAAAARGDHLAFTDDDCVPDPGWLSALTASVSTSGAEASTGRVLPLASDTPGFVPVSSRLSTTKRTFAATREDFPWDAGTGGNLLVSRALFVELGGFDPEFGPGGRFRAAEDVELLERMLADGGLIAFEPSAVVRHEMKPGAGRWRRRFPYGFGMGALVARAGEGRKRLLARGYVAMQLRIATSGVRRLSVRRFLEPLLSLMGFAAGLIAGRPRGGARESGAQPRP